MVMKCRVRLLWKQPFFFRQGGITQVVTSIQPEHFSDSPPKIIKKKEVK